MDKGADGGGAFHRVRQPDMQRELGAFAYRACKKPDTCPHEYSAAQDAGDGQVMQLVNIKSVRVDE